MKNFFKGVFYVLITFIILSTVIDLLEEGKQVQIDCKDQFIVVNEKDRWHQRYWNTNENVAYFCTTYESIDSISMSLGKKRNEILYDIDNYENFWGKVYGRLVSQNKKHLSFLVDSLRTVSNEQNLNHMALAELVVSFVQDIPYSYIRSTPCAEAENNGKPCVGNIMLGILSPYEFIHSLYGDCDTRAVLIYSILEELGYDPMIVVSNQYAHAMLALNIPATGDYLKYRGKNYYFWETTGLGWPIGMLPPNSNNIDYWKVALVKEN